MGEFCQENIHKDKTQTQTEVEVKKMPKLLLDLLAIHSPSSKEDKMRDFLSSIFRANSIDYYIDKMGNIIAKKQNFKADKTTKGEPFLSKDKRTLAISAHLDEISFAISYIDKGAKKIFFNICSRRDISSLEGKEILIFSRGKDYVKTIKKLEKNPPENQSQDNAKTSVFDFYLDFCNEEDIFIKVGDLCVLKSEYINVKDDFFTGKAFDNKSGIFASLSAFLNIKEYELSPDVQIVFIGTIKEEIGLRGASFAANNLQIDECIVVDVGYSVDEENGFSKEEFSGVKLGNGVILSRGVIINDDMFFKLEKICQEEKMPYQVQLEAKLTSSDADAFEASGIKTALLSIPLKNMHSNDEIVSLKDLDFTAKLIELYAKKF